MSEKIADSCKAKERYSSEVWTAIPFNIYSQRSVNTETSARNDHLLRYTTEDRRGSSTLSVESEIEAKEHLLLGKNGVKPRI